MNFKKNLTIKTAIIGLIIDAGAYIDEKVMQESQSLAESGSDEGKLSTILKRAEYKRQQFLASLLKDPEDETPSLKSRKRDGC